MARFAALVPLVPRRYQYIVGRRSDRLLPEDAVGLPIPAVGDRARRRAPGVAVTVEIFPGPAAATILG